MKAKVTLKPGQNGTKKYVTEYGHTLVCVRYRYDAQKRKKYKTVEIIVSELDWDPPQAKYPDGALLGLKIGLKETALQAQVKAVGGRWDKERKVWIVPYGCIRGTRLEKFIVIEIKTNKASGQGL